MYTVLQPVRRPLRNSVFLRYSRALAGLSYHQCFLLSRALHNIQISHHRHADPRAPPGLALRSRQGHPPAQRGLAEEGRSGRGAAYATARFRTQSDGHFGSECWRGNNDEERLEAGVVCGQCEEEKGQRLWTPASAGIVGRACAPESEGVENASL